MDGDRTGADVGDSEIFEGYFLEHRKEEIRELRRKYVGQSVGVSIDWRQFTNFEPDDDRFDNSDVEALARQFFDDPELYLSSAKRGLLEALPRVDPVEDAVEGVEKEVEGDVGETVPDILKHRTDVATSGPEYTDASAIDPSKITPRVVNTPTMQIRDLRSSDINKMVSLSGIVKKRTVVIPKFETAVFYCTGCGQEEKYTNDSVHGMNVPNRHGCDEGGQLRPALDHPDCEYTNAQRITLQERPETITTTEQPKSIEVRLEKDLVGKVSSGDRVTITGIFRPEAPDDGDLGDALPDTYIEGVGVQIDDKDISDYTITSTDVAEIEELANSEDPIEKIVDSIAPSIYGNRKIKEGIAYQLFGASPKRLESNERIRGDIHLLMVGDPGTGKSVMLKYAEKVAPRGIFTSGKNASAAGLTAAAVRDDFGKDEWTLEAGALVLADRGLAAVDELDKMDSSDREAIHEGLEQQEISISKAGINATMKARCALLGGANPKYGRFDEYEPFAEQINLDPALISRFDLIFTIQDRPDEEEDEKMADHVLKTNERAQAMNQTLEGMGADLLSADEDMRKQAAEEIGVGSEEVEPEIDSELLRKYIAHARKNVSTPRLSDEAREHIKDFYLDIRMEGKEEGNDEVAPVPITARKLEAIVRIAEASARIHLRDEITIDDAKRATDIVLTTLKTVGIDPETGELDADITETGVTARERKESHDVIEILHDIMQTEPGEMDHIDEDDHNRYKEDGIPPKAVVEHPACDLDSEKEVKDRFQTLNEGGEVYGKPHKGVVPI